MDFTSIENLRNLLKSVDRRKKPKLLVVDDEPDNLDLLYRTFRREFQVYKANSGVEALDVLSQEGEVAVIISDQRMPEMKGTEFLSKTVPDFPDTVRIILTGFTDVEDLVDAINSGQVYKYITKPWDPNELKGVVQRASDSYEVLKQRGEDIQRAQAQTELMATILATAQEANALEDILSPVATAFAKSFTTNTCILQLVEGGQLSDKQGIHAEEGSGENWLSQDPLTQEAIASGDSKIWVNSRSTPPPEGAESQYEGLQLHLVVPILYRKEVLAVLSLQWKEPSQLQEDELKLIYLAAQQVALAIVTNRS